MRRRFSRPLIPAALALLLIVSAAGSIISTSAVFDEGTYLHMSEDVYLRGDSTGLWRFGVAPLPLLAGYAVPVLAGPFSYRVSIRLARVSALVLFGVPVVLLTYAWLLRDTGRLPAAAGAGMLALSPNFIAHASVATTDLCFVAAALWALYALARYAEQRSRRRLMLLATALGVAMAAKYGAVGLFPVVALTLWATSEHRFSSLRQFFTTAGRALAITIGLLVGSLTIAWALHGFAVADLDARFLGVALRLPASVHGVMYQIWHNVNGHQGFLLGERRQTGWWYYTPATLFVKSTPIELLVLAISINAFVRTWRLPSTSARVWRIAFATYLLLAVISRVNIGIRYVLLLLPLAVLMASVQLSRLQQSAPLAAASLAAAALSLQAWSTASTSPHFLSYFNDIVGGRAAGYRYLADSNVDWGQDLPALRQTLERLGAQHPIVAYFGTAPFDAYGLRAVKWPGTSAERQTADWVAVSATHLNGVYLATDPFSAFRAIPVSARAADTMLLYKLDRPEVREAMRLAIEKTTPQ